MKCICDMCNGTGYVKEASNSMDYPYVKKCPKCKGGGYKVEQKQTNEEYIRTANVNDMARCIATKLCELARHEYGIYDVVDYATIFEWLKEKHNA